MQQTKTVQSQLQLLLKKDELTDIIPSQEDGTNRIEYVYKKDEGSQEAIDQYVKYLEEEKAFVKLSEDENDSEKNTETNAQESSQSTDVMKPLHMPLSHRKKISYLK